MGRMMRTSARRLVVAVTLACLLLATLGITGPAAGRRDIVYHLYGSRAQGWGFSDADLRIPGPTIEAWVGDNVTLNLTSLDNRNTRRLYIDYNNNSAWDSASEPRSWPFGTGVLWNFTASNVTGTYPYRSTLNGDAATMWGNLTISPEGTGGFPASGLVIAGIVVLAIAVVAILVYFTRRSRSVPPPPPPEG